MPRSPRPRRGTRIVAGAALVTLGVLLTLDRAGYLDASDWIRWWPLLLIAVGVERLGSRELTDRVFSAGAIGIGLWLLLWSFRIISLSPFDLFWPLVFILLGGALSRGAWRRPAADGATRVVAFCGGADHRVTGPSFGGGDATAIMGGCRIDLRQASLPPSGAEFHIIAFWGGVTILVPTTWRIDSRILPLLGAFDDRTEAPAEPDGPVLRLSGLVLMGGVEVRDREEG